MTSLMAPSGPSHLNAGKSNNKTTWHGRHDLQLPDIFLSLSHPCLFQFLFSLSLCAVRVLAAADGTFIKALCSSCLASFLFCTLVPLSFLLSVCALAWLLYSLSLPLCPGHSVLPYYSSSRTRTFAFPSHFATTHTTHTPTLPFLSAKPTHTHVYTTSSLPSSLPPSSTPAATPTYSPPPAANRPQTKPDHSSLPPPYSPLRVPSPSQPPAQPSANAHSPSPTLPI